MTHRDDDPTFVRLVTAHHEAGHAAAYIAGGGQVRSITLGDGGHGDCDYQERDIDADDQAALLGWLATILAGGAAQAEYLKRHCGYRDGQARRDSRDNCGRDERAYRDEARRSSLSRGKVEREAERIVRRCWKDIHRLALDLNDRGHLTRVRL